MEVEIKVNCECGNSDTVLIKQGKEFPEYDVFTTELTIQDSINESKKFKSYQTNQDEFYIECKNCKKEIALF